MLNHEKIGAIWHCNFACVEMHFTVPAFSLLLMFEWFLCVGCTTMTLVTKVFVMCFLDFKSHPRLSKLGTLVCSSNRNSWVFHGLGLFLSCSFTKNNVGDIGMCKLAEIVKTSRCLRQIRLVSAIVVHASTVVCKDVNVQHMCFCVRLRCETWWNSSFHLCTWNYNKSVYVCV